jgi:hypothetical protein
MSVPDELKCDFVEPYTGARMLDCANGCGRSLEWTLVDSEFWNGEACSRGGRDTESPADHELVGIDTVPPRPQWDPYWRERATTTPPDDGGRTG